MIFFPHSIWPSIKTKMRRSSKKILDFSILSQTGSKMLSHLNGALIQILRVVHFW